LKVPRDLSGTDLAKVLRQFGYEISRQTESHIRLTSNLRGTEHHVTIPSHRSLKVGTLSAILADVAAYLERSRDDLLNELFR